MSVLQSVRRTLKVILYFAALFVCKSRRTHYGTLFIAGTEGDYFERSFAEFSKTPSGSHLLEDRPDTIAILSDRRRFEECPRGSLGRSYFDFMHGHGLDEGFYRTEILRDLVLSAKDAKRAWYRNRTGNHHDLYHVLSGYGPDSLGEAALMAFRFGQSRHRGVLALCAAMALGQRLRPEAVACMLEAYRRGRRATKLEMLPWELCLDIPLAAARSRLGIVPSSRCPSPSAYALDAYVGAQTDVSGPEELPQLAGILLAQEAA